MSLKRSGGATPGLGSELVASSGANTIYAVNTDALWGAASGSAYATKGNLVYPHADMKVYAITYMGTVVSGATYKAYVIPYSGTTVSSVTGSTSKTAGASDVGTAGGTVLPTLHLPFATPVELTAATDYILAVGRTDSTDTYALPVMYPTATGGFPFSSYLPKGSGRIAKAAPAASDTVNVYATGVVRMGVEWEWI